MSAILMVLLVLVVIWALAYRQAGLAVWTLAAFLLLLWGTHGQMSLFWQVLWVVWLEIGRAHV